MLERMRLLLAVWVLLAAWGRVAAAEDPAQAQREQRAKALAAELRCLVCQNQTIADSQAGLAVDLRRQIHEQLARGATDQQVRDYMTQRYGDFVLYRPPLRASTALLWAGPPLLLLGAVVALVTLLRRRQRAAASGFDPDDDAQLDADGAVADNLTVKVNPTVQPHSPSRS